MEESFRLLLVLGFTAPFAFGIFCAYWAQQNNRNAWLWFFAGALLMPIAGIVLLMVNKEIRKHGKDGRPGLGKDAGRSDLLSTRKDVI